MAVTVEDLLEMQQKQLDDLFSAHEAGPIPDGEARGTAIIAPGTPRSRSCTASLPSTETPAEDRPAATAASILARLSARPLSTARQEPYSGSA